MNTFSEITQAALSLPPMSAGWSVVCLAAILVLAFVTGYVGAAKRMKNERGIKNPHDGADGIEPIFFGFVFAVMAWGVAYAVSFYSWPWLVLAVILSVPFVGVVTKLARLFVHGMTRLIDMCS